MLILDPVAIVVDSAASLPESVLNNPHLHIVPMTLTIDGEELVDGIDIKSAEFYDRLRQSPGGATTSAPSPGAFSRAFENAYENSKSILCIVVASEFSATENAARTASKSFLKSHPDCTLKIIDSQSAAGGEGLIVLGALKKAECGATFSETLMTAEKIKERVSLLAFVDTLFYLWKGGRVPRIAHAGVSLLKLKPTFELRHSRITNHGRPRTVKNAMKKIIRLMSDRIGDEKPHVSVNHARSLETATILHERVVQRFDCIESYVTEFTPVMGAHIGPGLIGVAFWTEKN